MRYEEKYTDIVQKAKAVMPRMDTALFHEAFLQFLEWLKDKPEEEAKILVNHSLNVVLIVAKLRLDNTSLIVALLHKVLIESLASKKTVEEKLSKDVVKVLKNFNKIAKQSFRGKTQRSQQIKSFRKMFLAMAGDMRVILVNLADKLQHSIDAVSNEDEKFRHEIGKETLDIYAPIASRMGIQWLKAELENAALKLLDTEAYQNITKHIETYSVKAQEHVDSVVNQIQDLSSEHNVNAKIYGRRKHHYSIYRKMEKKQLDIDQLYDIVAFRVIVKNMEQCYQILGLVHANWRPIQGMFTDYIAMPKPNGYQSLHTKVIDEYGHRMEIQIRTEAMHDIAENGIAAHWKYKEVGSEVKKPDNRNSEDKIVLWMQQILEDQRGSSNPDEVFENLKLDLFSDYVFAFTPKGDVAELPKSATLLDFAFSIHTEVGMTCTGGKVNSKMMPLKHVLQNGDVVEIFTQKTQKPKKEWLDFVTTNRAKTKIRHSIREEERNKSRELGQTLLEKEFKNLELNFNRHLKDGKLDEAAQELKKRNIDEAFIEIGRGFMKVTDIIQEIAPDKIEQEEEELLVVKPPKRVPRRSKSGVIVSGIDDIDVHFAKCCNPVPGDKIAGFITRGKGVTIHHSSCPKLKKIEQARQVDADWATTDDFEFPVKFKILSNSSSGILQSISNVFSKHSINISSVDAKEVKDEGRAYITVLLKSIEQMEMTQRELRKIKGVNHVSRIGGRLSN